MTEGRPGSHWGERERSRGKPGDGYQGEPRDYRQGKDVTGRQPVCPYPWLALHGELRLIQKIGASRRTLEQMFTNQVSLPGLIHM